MQKYDTVRQLPDERIGLGRFYVLPVLVPEVAQRNAEYVGLAGEYGTIGRMAGLYLDIDFPIRCFDQCRRLRLRLSSIWKIVSFGWFRWHMARLQ